MNRLLIKKYHAVKMKHSKYPLAEVCYDRCGLMCPVAFIGVGNAINWFNKKLKK